MGAKRLGLLYAIFASFSVSIASALVKSSTLPIGQTYFISSFFMFFISFLVAVYRDEYIVFPKGQRVRLLIFSLITGLVSVWDYEAMRLMPLGDEVVVSYTSVVFTILLARLFLKEACGRSKLLCAAFIITGVGLISKSEDPTGGSPYPKYRVGLFLTLFAAFFDATTYIFIKELVGLHFSVVLINCGCASMVITGPMHFFEDWRMPSEPLTLLLIAVLSLLQELFLYKAVTEGEEASLISLLQASDIVFSYLWEVSFFCEPHTLLRLLGAGLVSCGVCLAALASDSPKEAFRPLLQDIDLPLFAIEAAEKIMIVPVNRSKQIVQVKWKQGTKLEK